MKYKVGDRVTIKKHKDICNPDKYPSLVYSMYPFCGQSGYITIVYEGIIKIDIAGHWEWSPSWIEPYSENKVSLPEELFTI